MFGVPQSRPRVWIIAIRSDVLAKQFAWPKPHPQACANIDSFLDPDIPDSATLASATPAAPHSETQPRQSLGQLAL
eukprot:9204060-Alexandrium_andersonii.AAC.1